MHQMKYFSVSILRRDRHLEHRLRPPLPIARFRDFPRGFGVAKEYTSIVRVLAQATSIVSTFTFCTASSPTSHQDQSLTRDQYKPSPHPASQPHTGTSPSHSHKHDTHPLAPVSRSNRRPCCSCIEFRVGGPDLWSRSGKKCSRRSGSQRER